MKIRFLLRAFKARYRNQATELAAIKRALRPNDTVCDIGANKGSYLYWLSRWVPRGRVVAFEPQERLVLYLRRVCTTLALNNVAVEAKAVGAKTGTLTLYVSENVDCRGASLSTRLSAGKPCRRVPVPVVALDDYFDPGVRIGALKIDVEGAERGVFEGARRLLSSQSPLLVFESENRLLESGSVFDIFRYLTDLGYEGQFVCGKVLRPLNEFDPSVHQKEAGHRFWDAKDYYNNFIFQRNAERNHSCERGQAHVADRVNTQ